MKRLVVGSGLLVLACLFIGLCWSRGGPTATPPCYADDGDDCPSWDTVALLDAGAAAACLVAGGIVVAWPTVRRQWRRERALWRDAHDAES